MSAFSTAAGLRRSDIGAAFLLGLLCVVVTHGRGAGVARWSSGYAIDDLTRGVTRAKLLGYGGAPAGHRPRRRRVPVPACAGSSSARPADIEYDMRNDFFAHLQKLPLAYFQAHRTGDLMSRATNDLNAVRMMIGPSIMYSANTHADLRRRAGDDAVDRRAADAAVAHPAAVRVDLGEVLRQRDSQAVRADSGAAVGRQRRRAGSAVRRPRRARLPPGSAPSSSASARSNEEYLRRNRRLIVLQGFFFPSMSFFLGLGALLVLWLGSREVIRGRITLGEFVAFNSYLTMLALADDRVRLGHQHAAARHGVVEADAGSAGDGAGDSRRIESPS